MVSLEAWIQSTCSHYPWVQMSLWCQTVKRTIQQMSDGAYCLYQSLFSLTHTYSHTTPLYHQDLSLFRLFSWAMAQQISWFTSLKCDKYRVTRRESELLSLVVSLAVPESEGPPLRSRTPLNIHARPYKLAWERLVSANSRATKRNFYSELKHLSISQLWRTHNKFKQAHSSQIKALMSKCR